MQSDTVTMFRPTGPEEYELVKATGFRAWPPRLPGQPIFYPVTNENYAVQIAKNWNVPDFGTGYVMRFEVRRTFAEEFPIQTVGGPEDTEWWIPADRVDDLNNNIVGLIEVIHRFP